MMMIKSRIGPSPIEGIGIFADEVIQRGTLVWRYDDRIDRRMSDEEFQSLPEAAREFVERYAYRNKRTGMLTVCGDNARFYNHSSEPSTEMAEFDETTGEYIDRAVRDLRPGDEITCDYRLLEGTTEALF